MQASGSGIALVTNFCRKAPHVFFSHVCIHIRLVVLQPPNAKELEHKLKDMEVKVSLAHVMRTEASSQIYIWDLY